MVAVLPEVLPEIHVVPLNVHKKSIAGEELVVKPCNMLAVCPFCLVQNEDLIVEILC